MIRFPIDFLLNTTVAKKEEPVSYEKPAVKRYWPVPPLIESVTEYQNVNKDINLRKDVTKFFHEKVIKWVSDTEGEYAEFKQFKPKLTFLKSTDGQMHIYNLLRHFVKKSGINWYDLRDNYSLIKEFLSKRL